MSDELKASRLKADYAEKMLHTANRQLDELTRAHAEVLDTLDDLLDKYSVHNRASVGAQLVSVQHILTDLIAELRGYQEDLDATEHALDSFGGCLCDELGQADRCTMHNLRMVARMADRAEARLRTLQTPGGPVATLPMRSTPSMCRRWTADASRACGRPGACHAIGGSDDANDHH